MRKLILAILLIQSAFLSPQYHIKKIWLFTKTQYAGNVPKPHDGRQAPGHTNVLLCFMEVSKGQQIPVWEWAYFKGNKYPVSVSQINQDSVLVGNEKSTYTPLMVKAGADTKLVKFTLVLADNDKPANDQGFALEGTFNKKHAYLKANEPVTELSPVHLP